MLLKNLSTRQTYLVFKGLLRKHVLPDAYKIRETNVTIKHTFSSHIIPSTCTLKDTQIDYHYLVFRLYKGQMTLLNSQFSSAYVDTCQIPFNKVFFQLVPIPSCCKETLSKWNKMLVLKMHMYLNPDKRNKQRIFKVQGILSREMYLRTLQ